MRARLSEVIECLAVNEEKLSKLYSAYAAKSEQYFDFWSKLSNDELGHAIWLRSLKELAQNGSLKFNEKQFNPEAIRLFNDYLDQRIQEALVEEFSMERTLAIAWDIESSLIDRNWFAMLKPDSEQGQLTVQRLVDALTLHRKRVAQMLKQYRKDNSR